MEHLRGAWIDVNLDSIVHNAKEVQRLAAKDTGRNIPAMPVIKGNAYGHGVFEVAKALHEAGFNWLGVAVYTEALLAKKAAENAKILILGYTPPHLLKGVVEHSIRQTVYTYEQACTLSEESTRQNSAAYVHIKLDTGMHRLGFDCTDASADTVAEIAKLPNLMVEGLFTHFATSAMRDKAYVHEQYGNYTAFMEKLKARGVEIPFCHISNTGIILDNPEYHQDLIRFGSMVFGTFSSNEVSKGRVSLQDAFSLRAEVACIKDLSPGVGVGYDLNFTTRRHTKTATLPLGYADIGIRRLRNRGYVLLHGKRAPMIGNVCMDQMMVDITNIENVKCGDVATVIGRDGEDEITIQEVADRMGTDGYELTVSANHRLPICYWKDGQFLRMLDVNTALLSYYDGLFQEKNTT